jgi:Mn-dependent DtxR family transcriptional regulator
MPDEQPIPDLAAAFDRLERDMLYLLTEPDGVQPIWSVEDLGRVLEQPANATDVVHGLHRDGLIHKTSDGFVFATRAGVRMVQIVGQVV